ncbi:MAG: 6-bladed beta-propeller, partial [Gemmatimonadota bacterium]
MSSAREQARWGVAALLAIPLIGAACGGGESEAAPDDVTSWTLVPELTVGGADEGPASFSQVRGIAVDGQGRIYVLEGQDQSVRTFDTTGTFVRTIGRSGDGPGEFRGANGIAIDQSDRLWVYDPRARRVTIFDSAGVLAETHALTIQSRGYTWGGGVDTEGRLYDLQSIRVDTLFTPFIRRTDFANGTTDTIAVPRCEGESFRGYEFHSERSNGVIGVPFAPSKYVHFHPRGRAWCGYTSTLSIAEFRLGDTIPYRTLSAIAHPDTVTPAERDSAIEAVLEFGRGIGKGDPDFGLIPATKPVLEAIDPDAAERLWVRARTSDGLQLFVFDSSGRHVATAAFPVHAPRW